MKPLLIFLVAACCCALAQAPADVLFAPMQLGVISLSNGGLPGAVVKGAPFSATITNESVQTLADGTHISQSSTGSTARDALGRTRQDTPLPTLGGLAPADAPHFVFIQDPVAGLSYSLNLTEKTAWKHSLPPGAPGAATSTITTRTFIVRSNDDATQSTNAPATWTQKHSDEAGAAVVAHSEAELPPPPSPTAGAQLMLHKRVEEAEMSANVTTENLGTQIIEGVETTGVRTTRTIPVGKIGNDRPIVITTEVWTSPELKTIVLSKRSDPRSGEQTFKLTNIQRADPDPSLFTVPSDFKLTENDAETIVYRSQH